MSAIIFRVDAGLATGTGHLMEVVALNRAVKARRPETVTVLAAAELSSGLAADEPFDERIMLEPGDELPQLARLKEKCAARVTVCDLLRRPAAYYRGLRAACGRTLVILDDDGTDHPAGDVVVNFSVLQAEHGERQAGETQLLLGPRYFIAHPDLPAGGMVANGAVTDVFVNSGGSDPFGLTARIIAALAHDAAGPRVHCVVGGAVAEAEQRRLRAQAATTPARIAWHHYLPPREMFAVMARCQAAVTAAGNTLYELCRLGIPSLIISHHARHAQVAAAFAARGYARDLGIGPALSDRQLRDGMRAFLADATGRAALARNLAGAFTADGTALVARRLLELAA